MPSQGADLFLRYPWFAVTFMVCSVHRARLFLALLRGMFARLLGQQHITSDSLSSSEWAQEFTQPTVQKILEQLNGPAPVPEPIPEPQFVPELSDLTVASGSLGSVFALLSGVAIVAAAVYAAVGGKRKVAVAASAGFPVATEVCTWSGAVVLYVVWCGLFRFGSCLKLKSARKSFFSAIVLSSTGRTPSLRRRQGGICPSPVQG